MTTARACRAVCTIEQMLRDRGEDVGELAAMSAEQICSTVQLGGTVHMQAGGHDILFFTNKLKTSDLVKAASDLPPDRLRSCILVTMEPMISVHTRAAVANFGPEAEMFSLHQLEINISRHRLVPKHELVPKGEVESLREQLCISSLHQLPLIESSDPMAKYVRARPGDVVKVTRVSPTCGTQVVYRFCRR